MRGCLFVLLAGVVVVTVIVVVGLPLVASALIAGGLQAAGLRADDLAVTAASDPPTDLLGLRADTVHVTTTDATFRQLRIGTLDLTLGDVALLARTAGPVDGTLSDVTVTDADTGEIPIQSVGLGGTAADTTVSIRLGGDVAEALVLRGVERALGVRPERATLKAPDTLGVTALGVTQEGRLLASPAGDLDLRLTNGPAAGTEVVLLDASKLPFTLTDVHVRSSGTLELDGTLDGGLLGPTG